MLVAPGHSVAQGSGLELQIDAGLGGYYRGERWTPTFVRIANQPRSVQALGEAADFQGQLMVLSRPHDGPTPLRFLREVDVPRASTKRYVIYAKFPEAEPNSNQRHDLLLNAQNGRLLERHALPLQSLRKHELLVVNVSDELAPPGFPRMREQTQRLVYAHMAPDRLPDFWAAYDAADVVVIRRWPDRGINPRAVTALRDWVVQGGTVILLGGANEMSYRNQPGVSDLMPGEVLRSATLRADEASRGFAVELDGAPKAGFPVTLIHPAPDAEVLLSASTFPLITRQRLGSGQLVFCGLDLSAQSVDLENFLAPAWHGFMPQRNLGSAEYDLGATLQSNLRILEGGAARPPNPFVMIILCVAYAITVGPINFLILGRYNKLEWAWLTLPAIVAVFFVLTYGVGRLMKGDSQTLRELTVERYRAGQTEGHALSAVTTFVASAGRHTLTPANDRHAVEYPWRWHLIDDWRGRSMMQNFGGAIPGGQSAAPLSGSAPLIAFNSAERLGQQNETLEIRTQEMGTYDAQLYLVRGPSEMAGALEADLRLEPPAIVGTIRNGTGRNFKRAWLLHGPAYLDVGPLAAGASFELRSSDVLRTYPNAFRDPARPSRWLPEAGLFRELRAAEGDDEIGLRNAGVLMDALLRPAGTGILFPPEGGRLLLVGLSEASTPRVLSSVAVRSEGNTLLTVVEIPVVVSAKSRFEAPRSVAVRRLLNLGPDAITGLAHLDGDSELLLRDARSFHSFELPFQLEGTRVRAVAFEAAPRLSTNQRLTLSVLLPGPSGGWVEAPLGQDILNPAFVSPVDGRLFVRFLSQQEGQGNLMQSWQDGSRIGPVDVIYTLEPAN
jgi:hypothetical protein